MFDVKPIDLSEKGLSDLYALLHKVFPHAHHFSKKYLDWHYLRNPNGLALGSNIYDGHKLIAHFVTQPISSIFNGLEEKGLLALNIATHPDYRGKGLFKMAGVHALEEARKQGYQHVIGVANANSTKVFVKHLNFQLLGALEVKLGVGGMPATHCSHRFRYKLNWGPKALSWRLSRPLQEYFYVSDAPNKKIYTRAPLFADWGPHVEMGVTREHINIPGKKIIHNLNPFRMWIGLDASRDWSGSCYVDVPEKRRPSPLNFIFYDLTEHNRSLRIKDIKFDAMDFDAY